MLIAGFAWPQIANPRESWTEEMAKEYNKASAALHQAAHAERHQDGDHKGHAHTDLAHQLELKAAEQRFEQVKQQLETARDRPHSLGTMLKIAGSFLVAAGAVSLFVLRANQ